MSKCLDYQASHFLHEIFSYLWDLRTCFKRASRFVLIIIKSKFHSKVIPRGPEKCNFYGPDIPNEYNCVSLLTTFHDFKKLETSLALSKITLEISRGYPSLKTG